MSTHLATLRNSADLRRLSAEQLSELAREIRDRIITTISANGGHFGGPMGVVELAIALHTVFDFPQDRLIWDVGHQIYPHKLLTGRADRFHTLRLEGGLTGYPAPEESPHDLFATAHAGVATSTAAGLAVGDSLLNRDSRVVAVVGDGAMSCGVTYEALNHVGTFRGRQFLLILNDNNLSIDRGVGAIAQLLDGIRTSAGYGHIKQTAKHLLESVPLIGQSVSGAISSLKDGIRGAVSPHQIFEPLGFRYYGPVDGHDLPGLIALLSRMRDVTEQPVLLHVHTEKGRGFPVKRKDPLGFHALTPFTLNDGMVEKKPSKTANKSWTETFGEVLVDAAARHPKLCAITAAMPEGTGLVKFRERFADRYFDVAICEQHAVAFAAGLAKSGAVPVAAIYSTFLQRAFDQIFHEVSLQGLPVILAMDRGGVVGSDGPTHHGLADISYLRLWPNLVVCAPADAAELRECLDFAVGSGRAVAFRYPRDEAVADLAETLGQSTAPFELGRAVTYRTGSDAVLVGYGVMTVEALKAADILAGQGYSVGVVNPRFAKPLDVATLSAALRDYPLLVTIEDHFLTGGFGSAVLELAADVRNADVRNAEVRNTAPRSSVARVVRLGSPDQFTPHATRRRQLELLGLTAEKIAERVAAEIDAGRPREAAPRDGLSVLPPYRNGVAVLAH